MPRSGPQGTATPPPGGFPKNPGDVIPSAAWNQLFADLYAIANTPTPIGYGGTGASTAAAGYDNLSVKAADIPSATTTDIGAAAGRFAHITGTTTITSLGTKAAGVVREVTFDGALTLTHNATSLILPGAVNIVTAAGDAATFVSEGFGNWRCLVYQRVGTNRTTATLSGESSINVPNIPSGVSRITIAIASASLSTTANIALRLGTGGSVEISGYAGGTFNQGGTGATATTTFLLTAGSVSSNVLSGTFLLERLSGNLWVLSGLLVDSGTAAGWSFGGNKEVAGPLDILQLSASSGTFDAGSASVVWEY